MAVALASPFLFVSLENRTNSRSPGLSSFRVFCLLPSCHRGGGLVGNVPPQPLSSSGLQDCRLLSSFHSFPNRNSYIPHRVRLRRVSLLPLCSASSQGDTKSPRLRSRRGKGKKAPAPVAPSTPLASLNARIDASNKITDDCTDDLPNSDFPELNGNPLGRKILGKEVVKWVSMGMAAMASEAAAAEADSDHDDLEEKIASGLSFVMQAQHYLNINPMPSGFEALCLKASTHYPTLFDHFQRELQSALGKLQEEGVVENWKQARAWQLLKLHAKSGSHRVMARKASESKQLHEELGLAKSRIAEIQASVDQFVSKTLELLQIERNAELDATQSELNAVPSVEEKSAAAGPTEFLVYHGQLEQEQCDTICNLMAVSSSTGLGGTHVVTFRVEGGHRLPPTNISPGDMVCIRICDIKGAGSTECIQGFVHSLSEDGASISAAVEARYGDPIFSRLFGRPIRIDRISALADPTTYERNVEALQQLQKLGLHKKNPAASVVATLFGDGPDICWLALHGPPSMKKDQSSRSDELYDGLDESQSKAVQLGLNRCRPVVVIQGPPGSGKTTVVCKLICEAVSRGERVLATAPTNAAVDNLVEKLASSNLNIVRIGNPFRVAPAVSSKSLSAIVESKMASFQKEFARRRADLRADLRQCLGDDDLATGIRQLLKQLSKSLKHKEKEVIDDILKNAQVVISTNTSSGEPLVQKLPAFDMVLIDEAAQAVEPACWIPLLKGRRAVLAGDPCQLAPVILSRKALESGFGVSLMERAFNLHDGNLRTTLSIQYRMNDVIARWTSKEMYQGELVSSSKVASHVLADSPGVKDSWTTQTPLLLLDTRLPFGSLASGCEECLDPAGTGSYFNEGEADAVMNHVRSLIDAGVPPSSIVVQSPYIAQVQLLRDRVEDLPNAMGLQIASVDSFQGREADAVIISMVRSNSLRAVGFLGDRRRINVAITRARKHVAVVCDSSTISNNKFLLRLLQHIRQNGVVQHVGSGEKVPSLPSRGSRTSNASAEPANR
ncbi:hypothetical protein GOP47_0003740 [Adiantum capillus-veneris]|uniref:Helicase ATP-binding domain-containing protein n=1 Tax=Adiantum capillus-veneris TaxID=13818 RepID=A0A9D4ZNU9_ADICA|nr:hypothetical protein GOP47_0003740 [Adiantum capillus-veneris]